MKVGDEVFIITGYDIYHRLMSGESILEAFVRRGLIYESKFNSLLSATSPPTKDIIDSAGNPIRIIRPLECIRNHGE